jgi:hypothetical protein
MELETKNLDAAEARREGEEARKVDEQRPKILKIRAAGSESYQGCVFELAGYLVSGYSSGRDLSS